MILQFLASSTPSERAPGVQSLKMSAVQAWVLLASPSSCWRLSGTSITVNVSTTMPTSLMGRYKAKEIPQL
jgi:hypothetical protein